MAAQVALRAAVDAGFFKYLARGRERKGLIQRVFAASDRLPKRACLRVGLSAADQQHVQGRGVNHHQHGFGNFEKVGHGEKDKIPAIVHRALGPEKPPSQPALG